MSGLLETALQVALVNAVLGAAACVVVWCVRRTGVRPALLHGLWLLVLARLIAPPLVALPVLPAWPTPTAAVPAIERPIGSLVAADRPAPPPAPADRSRPTFEPWMLLVPWATGSALVALVVLRRRRRMTRVLETARPASSSTLALARRLAADLGLAGCPPVVVVEARVSPMVWCAPGGLRIVLPAALAARLPRGGLETVLAHELAHVRRRDHWTRRLETAVTVLCWWAPALWWARAGLRRAEERCCDLWVVRVRPALAGAYARTLVETAAFVNESKRTTGPLPALASGAAPVRQLKERVTMIMRNERRESGTTTRTQRLLLAAVAIGALAIAPAALESTAGEPTDRDALSRESVELTGEVERLERQIAELLTKRQALELEIERLVVKREQLDGGRIDREAIARDRERMLAERELVRAELLRARALERERRSVEEVELRERDLARALATDARERSRTAREQASELRRTRDAVRSQLHELRLEAERRGDPDVYERLEREMELLQERLIEMGAVSDERVEPFARSLAERSRLEAKILELEAAGHAEEAERLRRQLESSGTR